MHARPPWPQAETLVHHLHQYLRAVVPMSVDMHLGAAGSLPGPVAVGSIFRTRPTCLPSGLKAWLLCFSLTVSHHLGAGDVMSALASKQGHIPFRNSKLTQLLQDSLCGQAKAMMFMHIAPEVGAKLRPGRTCAL